MKCHFLCFYNNEFDRSHILDFINKIPQPCQIITNNDEIYEIMKNENKKCTHFKTLFQQYDKQADEIFHEARKIREEYRSLFKNVIFKGVEIFKGFEYQLLLQIKISCQGRKILQEKENTIFIFEKFHPAYFIIMKIAKELGYDNEIKVGLLQNKKIEYMYSIDDGVSVNYSKRTSNLKAVNFAKSYLGKNISLENIKNLIRLGIKVISLKIKMKFYKTNEKSTTQSYNSILNNIKKKIVKLNHQNVNSIIFLTAVRLDLFFRPLMPAVNEFNKKKIPIVIVTGDISTGLALQKEKIPFVNFFEEANILSNVIKNMPEGIKIEKLIKEKFDENQQITGVNEMLPDILKKTFRIMSLIIIFGELFKDLNPKSILDGGTTEIFEHIAVEVAKKFNATSYTVIPSPPTPNPEYADAWNADKFFLEGLQGAKIMKQLGYSEDKFLIVGGARYDHYNEIKPIDSKKNLELHNKIDLNKKLIVVAMSRWHENDEKWIADLIKFCNTKNFEIIIKIHPQYKITAQNVNKNKIDRISKTCENTKFLISYDLNITTLLSAADLVITDWSSVGFEAILLGKPLLQAKFTNEDIEPTVRYYSFQAAILVESYEKLERSIIDILVKKINLNDLKMGREEIIKQYNFRNDGKAAKRICSNLIDFERKVEE
jgi:hypothetical protein